MVRQFMPLVGHAIKGIKEPIVSETELQALIFDVMQFKVPVGAIRVFINRAANHRYNYLIKNSDGTYSPNRAVLANIRFSERLQEARRRQTDLFASFSAFCISEFATPLGRDDAERYFFEILFDIAPIVMKSLADPVKNKLSIPDDENTSEGQVRYRVYRFVANAARENNLSLQYIEEFIHGAIMAESLFYSTPAEALHRMNDVKVFLDTPILISVLGLSNDAESQATRELIDLLKILKARVRCFRDTFRELHGIIYAIAKQKERGQKYRWRPGDVGEAIDRRGLDLSDLTVLLNSLEQTLNERGVSIEDRPQVIAGADIGIDESALAERIRQSGSGKYVGNEDAYILDRRLQHDLDCVRAIFQMRSGQPVSSLEKCKAIFVTTASKLTRVTAEFFTEHDSRLQSSVPLCIGSSVFTMLMWLKATDRKPTITKDRLVANSIAALTPSPEVWEAFLDNLRKMLGSGEIDQAQFDYISNAMETRTILMAETEGDVEALSAGTVQDVREQVMSRLVKHKDEEILSLTEKLTAEIDKRNQRMLISRNRIYVIVWRLFQSVVVLSFLYLLVAEVLEALYDPSQIDIAKIVALVIVNLMGALALFFIPQWKRYLRTISNRLADRVFLNGPTEDDGITVTRP